MNRDLTILEAMTHPALWSRWFRDPATWPAWRAFLAALFGLPMSGAEIAIYRQCTGRETAPAAGVLEAWLTVGRRGGKSMVLALIAAYLAVFRDWRPYLSPGEVGTIKVIATDRRQARVIHRYCRALLIEAPTLVELVARDTDDEILLTNGICIEVQTASFRAVRGYTIVAALLDEIAFWRNEDSANPDEEILAAIRPAMATIPGAMLLAASSPYARRGVLWQAYRRHYGYDTQVLVWRADTRTMNPTVPQSVIDEATERDPASAAAEYGAEFRVDIESFVPREVVEAAIVPGRFGLPPTNGVGYCAFVDPSGGSADSMTLAVAHMTEDQRAVVDCIREVRPPFDPEAVVAEFASLLGSYGIAEVRGDRYGGDWPASRFRQHGIAYIPSEKAKSDLYREVPPLLTASRVELPDNPRLTAQLIGLERRTARGGRDSIDHPPGGHDDLANAAAGALTLVASDAVPALWRRADLLANGKPAAWPCPCQLVFASLAADERGIALLYWARAHDGRVLLIDYETRKPFTPGLWAEIRDQLRALGALAHARVMLFTSTALAAQVRTFSDDQAAAYDRIGDVARARLAVLPVEAVDALLADRDGLLLACASAIGQGRVRLAEPAQQRSLHQPLPLAELRPGAALGAGTDAALIGLAAATVDLRSLPKAHAGCAPNRHAAGFGQSAAR